MIRRGVKVQLLVFLVITVLGISYVGARYVGLGSAITGSGYVVTADFAESGGIFKGAEVTYRGVTVGRVDALRLAADGVHVDLRLDPHVQVPQDTDAVVANRSAVGEQYVDLQPATRGAPYLAAGDRIPESRTRTPMHTETLLVNLDRLVNSVDRRDLTTVIDQLDAAFAGTGPDLQRLIDSGDALTKAASANLPQTIQLIEDGTTVLATQKASGSDDPQLLRRPGRPVGHPALQRRRPAQGARQRRGRRRAAPAAHRHQPAGDLGPARQPAGQRAGHGGAAARPRAAAGDLPRQRRRRLHRRPGRRHVALRSGAQRQRPAGLHAGVRRHAPALAHRHRAGVDQPRRPLHPAARQRRLGARGAERAAPVGAGGRRRARRCRYGPGQAGQAGRSTVSPPYLTGYDTTSGVALGAGGLPLQLRPTGGEQALGKDSWTWLLLGPMAR